jgi:16S rRNA (guanine(966)-N(2))-methyltransferase RsmD
MRVIAGKYRSRQLRSLRGMDVRPTTDRLRETLFNVLAPHVEDSVWLDLYAGTGAVGIEALSRGARTVYFVESSRKAVAVIRQNLRSLAIEEGGEVLEREAEPALRLLDSQAVSCDVCFLDPPYGMERAYAQVLGYLGQSRLLKSFSIVVAEHDKHFDPGGKFGALERYRELRQGDAVLSFYKLRQLLTTSP